LISSDTYKDHAKTLANLITQKAKFLARRVEQVEDKLLLIEEAVKYHSSRVGHVEYYGLTDSDAEPEPGSENEASEATLRSETSKLIATDRTKVSNLLKKRRKKRLKKKGARKDIACEKPNLIINKDGNIGYKGAMDGKGKGGANSTIKTGILGTLFADLNIGDMVIQFSNPFFNYQIEERLKIFEEGAKFVLLKKSNG
jgi:hypothetical protein